MNNNQNQKNNKHDVFNAGKTFGQVLNTSTYDSGYTRKKGMRFFLVIIIIIFIGAAGFLLLEPAEDINIMFADDNGITIHTVDTGIFRSYELQKSKSYEYSYEGIKYGKLMGKPAQIAVFIKAQGVDIVIADKETLLKLGLEDYTIAHYHLVENRNDENLLRHDVFENDFDLFYGIEFVPPEYIEYTGESGLAVVSSNDYALLRGTKWKFIKKIVIGMINGEDYTSQRIR